MENVKLEKYRIKGKIYYKVEELPIAPEDLCIVSSMWVMKNVKGETFKLLSRGLGRKEFTLYDSKSSLVFRTRSISKVEN